MKGSIFFTFHIMSYFLYSKTAVHYLQTGKVTYLLSTCTHSLHFKKNSHLSVMSMRRVFHQFSHYLCFVWGSVLHGSVVSDSLPPHGPQPARLLCPSDFPGKDILQWVAISSSRGSPDPEIEPESPVSPALKANSLLLSHWEWEEAPCLELFLCVEVVFSFFKI